MNQESSQIPIEQSLARFADGEREMFLHVRRYLSQNILFVPVAVIENVEGSQGINRVKVVTLNQGGKKVVPAFTTEDYFLNWSKNKYQFLSVIGADLAVTLPLETWVVVNPGTANSANLNPEEVALLAGGEEEGIGGNDENIDGVDSPSVVKQVFPDPFEGKGKVSSSEVFDAPSGSAKVVPPVDREDLRETIIMRLSSAVEPMTEILEAYYLDLNDREHTEGILGLLVKGLDPEKRFCLISDVAEISRELFGVAGAIEVYDDLNDSHSSSWEMFSALNPFFVRERSIDSSEGRSDSNEAKSFDELHDASYDYGENDEFETSGGHYDDEGYIDENYVSSQNTEDKDTALSKIRNFIGGLIDSNEGRRQR